MSKHRRSVGRRRTRSLVGFAAKDLCETIPKSLSPSERLLMLLDRSFQYALSVVQKKYLEQEDIDISSFRTDGATCWEKIKSEVEEKNLCELAVTEETLTNESLLGGTLMKNEETKMKAEFEKWDEILAAYRGALNKELESKTSPVSASEWKERDALYDYSDIIQYTSSTHEKLQRQVDTLSKCETVIKKSLKLNNVYNERLQRRCKKYFQPKISQSPRTLMKKLVSANKHYCVDIK